MLVVIKCIMCDESHDISVIEKDYQAWLKREKLAQDAFPYLDADNRELLISETCPTCWTLMCQDF